jgi:hypothetical protein
MADVVHAVLSILNAILATHTATTIPPITC